MVDLLAKVKQLQQKNNEIRGLFALLLLAVIILLALTLMQHRSLDSALEDIKLIRMGHQACQAHNTRLSDAIIARGEDQKADKISIAMLDDVRSEIGHIHQKMKLVTQEIQRIITEGKSSNQESHGSSSETYQEKKMVVSNEVKLRTNPVHDADFTEHELDAGVLVDAVERRGEWMKVTHEGITGWVRRKLLEAEPSNIISRADYLATFQTTGCPGTTVDVSWWSTQNLGVVLADMYSFCMAAQAGTANSHQMFTCCGASTCTPRNCVQQSSIQKALQMHLADEDSIHGMEKPSHKAENTLQGTGPENDMEGVPWFFLHHGLGVPVQCGDVNRIRCASDDGTNCKWGIYVAPAVNYASISGVFARYPLEIDCPGWKSEDGTDACAQLGCYRPASQCTSNWHVFIRSHRGDHLTDAKRRPQLTRKTGRSELWQVKDTGDGYVNLKSQDNRYLADADGALVLGSEHGGLAKWRIIPCEQNDGKVFIVSHRNQNLQDFKGKLRLSSNSKGWEMWQVIEHRHGVSGKGNLHKSDAACGYSVGSPRAAPKLQNPQWMLTSEIALGEHAHGDGTGMSCSEACKALGRSCAEQEFRALGDKKILEDAVSQAGGKCDTFTNHVIHGLWDGPWVAGTQCGFTDSTEWVPSCEARAARGYERLCACAYVQWMLTSEIALGENDHGDVTGMSCSEACKTLGGSCVEQEFRALGDKKKLEDAVFRAGGKCDTFTNHVIHGLWDGPWVAGTQCGFTDSTEWVPTCAARAARGYERLCACTYVH